MIVTSTGHSVLCPYDGYDGPRGHSSDQGVGEPPHWGSAGPCSGILWPWSWPTSYHLPVDRGRRVIYN